MLVCTVFRYDEWGKSVDDGVLVEAATKKAAAEQVCGFKVVEGGPAGPRGKAVASVVCIGDSPNQRTYFRKA